MGEGEGGEEGGRNYEKKIDETVDFIPTEWQQHPQQINHI